MMNKAVLRNCPQGRIFPSLFLLLGLLLFFRVGTAIAQEGGLSFGIRPTKADEDRPESYSYFSFELEPGSVITDEALILNYSNQPITLAFYAADGQTAQNGGTSFTAQAALASGGSRAVSQWISLASDTVTLEAQSELVVPFKLSVPAEAEPGEYVAGLVLEANPADLDSASSGTGDAQFAVQIVQRVGVALVVNVPGPRSPRLEILNLGMLKQNEEGATFFVDLYNSGNSILKSFAILEILSAAGEELSELELTFDSLLPGDTATYNFDLPIHLSDSDYRLSLSMIYADGEIAKLPGVELSIRDGQPVGDLNEEELPQLPAVEELSPQATRSGLLEWLGGNTLLVLGYLLLLTAAIVAEILIIRKWKQR